jgi:hypothetical protein
MALRRSKTRYYSLVFLIILIVLACGKPALHDVEILYEQDRARSVLIPKSLLGIIEDDSISQLVSIRLPNSESKILGTYAQENELVFTPLIPFTPGLRYEIFVKDRRVTTFGIPLPSAAPVLTEIYPTQDTVPMNLLKVYLKFSKPMRSGEALKHIVLTRTNGDTAKGVFLDLQQELWNEDQTILTLWLDPGRIKRDLQPNKILGNPLNENEAYTLHLNGDWKDQLGSPLTNDRIKTFYVSGRDSLSPLPSEWKVYAPSPGTLDPVAIQFGEALDFSLSISAIHVMNKSKEIGGQAATGPEEKSWLFTPNEPWAEGTYLIEVEGRLEDLAGNNLNRPFDRDITTTSEQGNSEVSLTFLIK